MIVCRCGFVYVCVCVCACVCAVFVYVRAFVGECIRLCVLIAVTPLQQTLYYFIRYTYHQDIKYENIFN